MNIQINGNNLEISQKIRDLIDKRFSSKLDKLLTRFNDEIKTAFLSIEKDKYDKYHAQFNMTLPGGSKESEIYAQNQHETLLTTITGLREQVEKQIKKYKHE
jgi:ribosomal subunit interface protein